MEKPPAYASMGAAFVFFTALDVVRPLSATDAWLFTLYAMALVIGLAYRSVAYPLLLLMFAFMGPEDLLFFLLKRQLPPPQLPGLYSHRLILLQPATPLSLVVGLVVALAIGAVATLIEGQVKERL